MFDQLPESSRRRQRSVWQAGASISLHALIITGAVWATRTDLVDAEPPTVIPAVVFPTEDRTFEADRSQLAGTTSVLHARPAPDIPVVTNVPVHVPPVTTNSPPFDPNEFDGRTLHGDLSGGVTTGPDSVGAGTMVITSAEADEAPLLLQPGPMIVPPGMKGVFARVKLQFIIGVDGKVEPQSVKVLDSSSAIFEEPARRMIMQSTYRAARRQGESVRVLVQQGVSFSAKE